MEESTLETVPQTVTLIRSAAHPIWHLCDCSVFQNDGLPVMYQQTMKRLEDWPVAGMVASCCQKAVHAIVPPERRQRRLT